MEISSITSSAEKKEFYKRITGQALWFIVLGFLEFIAVELFLAHHPFALKTGFLLQNLLLYLMLNLMLLSLFRRIRPAMLLSLVCVLLLGLGNYFLQLFRGYGLVWMDLYAIHTAAGVAGQYSPEWHPCFFGGLAVWLAAVLLCFFCMGRHPQKTALPKRRKYFERKACLLSLAGLAAGGLFFFWVFSSTVFFRDVNRVTWDHRLGMQKYGYLLYFMANASLESVSEPAGYSPAQAEKILSRYMAGGESGDGTQAGGSVAPSAQNPNLILVMNEAYADLRVLGEDFHTNQPVMPFYDSLQENTVKGFAASSVYGGYTANSEFEFLTGCSKAFLPGNPYLQYITEPLPTLVTMLKEQAGYASATALHPYHPSGYSRNRVYPLLGFDEFLSLPDFSGQEYLREYVSDSWDYRRIIEQYEGKEAGTSLCLFNVTIQNHAPYTADWTGNPPVQAAGQLGEQQINQYLSLMKKSDDALQELVAYFEGKPEPALVLLFGDHQPRLPDSFYQQVMGKTSLQYEAEDTMKKYFVPYLLWANYDIPEQNPEITSLNYLANRLLETAGLRTTAFQRFLLDMEKHLPSVSANAYYDAEGKLGRIGDPDDEAAKWLREYEILQYYYLFDTEHRENKYFTIS